MQVRKTNKKEKTVEFNSLNDWDTFEYLGDIWIVASTAEVQVAGVTGARKLTTGEHKWLYDENPQVKPVKILCTVRK